MKINYVPSRQQSNMTANPLKYPQKSFKDKTCKCCGSAFSPQSPSHMYCSQECVDKAHTDKYLKRTYGISADKYNEMLQEQDHKCAVCGEEGFLMDDKKHKVKLVVDHCHTSGAVRGLLCHNCNRALGLLKDNPESLQKALEYLEKTCYTNSIQREEK